MVLDGIAKRNFLVIGRVGMDLSPEPPGTRTADADTHDGLDGRKQREHCGGFGEIRVQGGAGYIGF